MKNKKNIWLCLMTILFVGNYQLCFAQSVDNSSHSDFSNTQKSVYPYEQTFTVTAYYSPIEGQKRYIKGSLEADKRLNGNGTNGADGTPVYPGMIAAPSSYPFGTKMKIEGLGTVAVHDRGGAIKRADDIRPYDRLDIWMGVGDEGLTRALTWGKRNVKVTVYGVDSAIAENIDWSSYNRTFVVFENNKMFSKDLHNGDRNEEVKKLKEMLAKLQYYQGTVDDYYDNETENAIIAFQMKTNIVDDQNDFGAGYFGPQTRKMLEKAVNNELPHSHIIPIAKAAEPDKKFHQEIKPKITTSGLSTDLELGDQGEAVKELQIELKKLNLFGMEPTGYYGEVTANAVMKFQQAHYLIADNNSLGAGKFGPLTRAKLNGLVSERLQTQKLIAEKKTNPEKLIANSNP